MLAFSLNISYICSIIKQLKFYVMDKPVKKHYYLYEGRRFDNMKECRIALKINKDQFKILRMVGKIEKIEY